MYEELLNDDDFLNNAIEACCISWYNPSKDPAYSRLFGSEATILYGDAAIRTSQLPKGFTNYLPSYLTLLPYTEEGRRETFRLDVAQKLGSVVDRYFDYPMKLYNSFYSVPRKGTLSL